MKFLFAPSGGEVLFLSMIAAGVATLGPMTLAVFSPYLYLRWYRPWRKLNTDEVLRRRNHILTSEPTNDNIIIECMHCGQRKFLAKPTDEQVKYRIVDEEVLGNEREMVDEKEQRLTNDTHRTVTRKLSFSEGKKISSSLVVAESEKHAQSFGADLSLDLINAKIHGARKLEQVFEGKVGLQHEVQHTDAESIEVLVEPQTESSYIFRRFAVSRVILVKMKNVLNETITIKVKRAYKVETEKEIQATRLIQ